MKLLLEEGAGVGCMDFKCIEMIRELLDFLEIVSVVNQYRVDIY